MSTKSDRLVEEFYNGTAEKDWAEWGGEAVAVMEASPDPDALKYAGELEKALMEIVNGKRKADRIPMEPMVRLIAYARTGSCANARIGDGNA